jgi:hypothetical protein
MKDIPAFPLSFVAHPTEETFIAKGMTLRDYFAAKAMQGFAAACSNEDDFQSWIDDCRGMAKAAYQWADAMMEARNG